MPADETKKTEVTETTGTENKAAETPKKEATPITEQAVADKVAKGEKLSPEETEVFKSIPPGQMPAATKEETPAKKEETPAKKEEAPAGTVTEDRKKLILEELDKPDSQVDLSKFTSPVELGLYWDLKKQRRKNAKLQDDLDTEKIERIVDRLKNKPATGTEEETAEDDAILEIIKDLKPDDIVSVADIQAAIKKREDAKAAKAAKKETKPQGLLSLEQIRIEKIEANDFLKEKGLDDFHEVTEFAEQVLKDDAEAVEILRDTAKAKGNTALKTYYLIKGSPSWPQVEKIINDTRAKAGKAPLGGKKAKEEVSAEDVAARAKKINDNDDKTKTTGTGTGANTNPNEFTIAEIEKMTSADVRKLSKKQRTAILEKFGSGTV